MASRIADWLITRFSAWLMREAEPIEPSFLCDFEKIRYELRPADVLLIEGRNRASSIIKQITQSNWSHALLYIGRIHDIEDMGLRMRLKKFYKGPADEQLLVESLMGKGTIVTPLSRYRNYHIRICRPIGLSGEDAQKVIGYAISRLGMKYNLRHILDLARFLFPWGVLPRRWRSSLFQHNALKPTEEICSYMLARAFQSVKFPILPDVIREKQGYAIVQRDPRLYTPRDFDFSPFFAIVKYPILSPTDEHSYRHLPWRENMVSDGKNNIYPDYDAINEQPTHIDQ